MFYVEGKTHEIAASHVLSNPLGDFTNILLALMNNDKEAGVSFWEEPSWAHMRIVRNEKQHHLLSVELSESEDQQALNCRGICKFVIQQKQFLIIALSQLKKIFLLLEDKRSAKENEFPYELYRQLLQQINETFPKIV